MNESSTQAGDINSKSKGMVVVLYKECLKNHAAALGGHSTDGCGEYMASSSDDTLFCSACGCHRNFHRKEVDMGGASHTNLPEYLFWCNTSIVPKNQVLECQQKEGVIPAATTSENEGEQTKVEGNINSKKRYRTRFTNDQKERMLGFAQKAGWKIQKLDEESVQQFCQEVGIKRRVLKIWMHNNKHLFAKKITNSSLDELHDASDYSNK